MMPKQSWAKGQEVVASTKQHSFDPQCHDLASYFTASPDSHVTEAQVNDLAQTIQTAIEDWFSNLESDRESARQSAADKAAGI